MPCEDPRDRSFNWDEIDALQKQIEKLEGKIDILTQDLCFLCGQLEGQSQIKKVASCRILEWWKKHKQNDEKRILSKMESFYSKGNNQQVSPTEVAKIFVKLAEAAHAVSIWHKTQWFPKMAENALKQYLRTPAYKRCKTCGYDPKTLKAIGSLHTNLGD